MSTNKLSRKYFEGRAYNKRFFRNINTEEKAYWLGFLIADGCIVPSKRTVAVSCSPKDKDHLMKLVNTIGLKEEDLREYRYGDKGYTKGTYFRLLMSSRFTYEDICRLGFDSNKTETAYIPKVNPKLLRHLIRGIFDGDGSISVYKSYDKNAGKTRTFQSFDICCTERLGNQVVEAFKKAGLQAHYKVEIHKGCYRLRASSRQAIIELNEYLYNDAKTYLERKKDTFGIAVLKLQN